MLRVTILAIVLATLASAPAIVPAAESGASAERGLVAAGARADGGADGGADLQVRTHLQSCAPAPLARASAPSADRAHVALSWEPCGGVAAYQVLRGPSLAELEPLAEVRHAGFIDVGVERGATYVYAVVPMGLGDARSGAEGDRGLPATLQGVPVKVA